MAGRYMSIAKGPISDIRPKTMAGRKRDGFAMAQFLFSKRGFAPNGARRQPDMANPARAC